VAKIQITKKDNVYGYRYSIVNDENKTIKVSKSGFKTLEEARKAANKSYNKRINSHPTPKKEEQEKQKRKTSIKNIEFSNGGKTIVELLTFSTVAIVAVYGGKKLISDFKDKFPAKQNISLEEDEDTYKELITKNDCDFSNLHIILRTATKETMGVGAVTSSMLTNLGVSNEIVSGDSDLSSKVSTTIKENPDSNIVVINIESGLENKKNNNSIVMGDCSNRREYPSDILVSCINASLNEYDLNSIIRSGEKADIWRTQSYIETELANSGLINEVSQLTVDLPIIVGEDEITRNDAAASITEGIMRWTTLDVTERYKDIYYTAQYGDTEVTIIQNHGISLEYFEENSDVDMHKGVRVGNTILVAPLPKVVTDKVVYNPCTTTDSSNINQVVVTYTVQSGDTVTKIANMYGVKTDEIVVPSGNINNIQIGDTVYITTCNLYETHKKIGTTEKHI
jgi:LysM repeat protein